MKCAALLLVLLSTACAVENKSSEVSGLPGSPVLMPRLTLSCVETKTFADAPGYESLISINQAFGTADVSRRTVSMAGNGEWEADANAYTVTEHTDDEALRLSIVENVDTTVDWKTHGSCFAFFPTDSYQLVRQADGRYTGESRLIPRMTVDPAQPDCLVPDMAMPRPIEVACTAE